MTYDLAIYRQNLPKVDTVGGDEADDDKLEGLSVWSELDSIVGGPAAASTLEPSQG